MAKKRGQRKEIEDVDWVEEEEEDRIDIYDAEQREEMLEDDEITGAENAFMEGREKARRKQEHDL